MNETDLMPRRRDPDATQAALEDAARQEFADHGFEGARTQGIAERAGVNKAMISYYYGGKLGLYSSVILQDVERAQERIAAADRDDAPALERLARFMRALADYTQENPAFPLILTREQMDGARHLEPHVRQRFFGFFGLVKGILEAGMTRGELREVEPHATHLSLVGALVYFTLTQPARASYEAEGRLPAPAPAWDDYVRHLETLFRRGIAADPTSDSETKTRGDRP